MQDKIVEQKVILSITAHPDDEILGFGGTAYQLVGQGFKVVNCMLSGEVTARVGRPENNQLSNDSNNAQQIIGAEAPIFGNFPNIKFNTVPHLELVQFIENVMEQVKPDYLFTHHPNDLNIDHHYTSIACQAASRLYQRREAIKRIRGLYFMEILSSTDWSYSTAGNQFTPNVYFEIGREGLDKKLEALNMYKGVMRDFPHSRSNEIVEGLSAYRGGQAGLRYAEAFQSVFSLLNI